MITIDSNNLKQQIEELYIWYFTQARNRAADEYHLGKYDGAVEALGAIYLGLYGGREMMRLWQRGLNEPATGD